MKLLRSPIKDRADVCAYTFPGDGSCDADAMAAEIAANVAKHEYTLFFRPNIAFAHGERVGAFACAPPPVVRVVPVSEADVYAEAADLLAQRLVQAIPGASAVVVGVDTVELTAPSLLKAPERQTIRLVQVLGS